MKRMNVLGLAPEELAAVTAVARSFALLRRAAERSLAASGDVNRAQFEVLGHLDASDDGLRMYELADRLTLSRSTLTHHVTSLVKAEFVEREGGTSAQRAVRVRITDSGRARVEQLRTAYAEIIRTHFIDNFSPAELQIVTDGFSRVAQSFDVDTDLADDDAGRI